VKIRRRQWARKSRGSVTTYK